MKPDHMHDDLEDMADDSEEETMEDLLDQIRAEHPEQYSKLQRLQAQMRDLDIE
jgi:hypothetical protein